MKLPQAVVAALGLKEGDEVEVRSAGDRSLTMERKMTREEAVEAIRTLSWPPMPVDFKFDREEANERPGMAKWLKNE